MKRKRFEREVPHIDGGWQGAASLPMVELLRSQRYTMEAIARGFGVHVRTIYWRMEQDAKRKGAA